MLERRKIPIVGLVLNRVRNKSFELSLDEIEEASGVPVIGILPEDINVPESIAFTTPAAAHRPMSNVSIEIKKLAAAIVNQNYHDPRVLPRLKRLFTKEPNKAEVNRDLLRKRCFILNFL